jgi:hypothetical protein
MVYRYRTIIKATHFPLRFIILKNTMADPDPEDSASGGISTQVNSDLSPKKHLVTDHSEAGTAPASLGYLGSIDDEERAKEIANEDLQASHKQVGYSPLLYTLFLYFFLLLQPFGKRFDILAPSPSQLTHITDLFRHRLSLAQLSGHWRHLWRYWHVTALRVLIHIFDTAVVGRSRWSSIDNNLGSYVDCNA